MKQTCKIIISRKYHQRDNQEQSELENIVFDCFVQLFAGHNLNEVNHDVTAVEQRNRKEVNQPQID